MLYEVITVAMEQAEADQAVLRVTGLARIPDQLVAVEHVGRQSPRHQSVATEDARAEQVSVRIAPRLAVASEAYNFV